MIVVTGAAGFIGSCIVSKLNERGINDLVVVDDIESSDANKNLTNYKYAQFIEKEAFLNLVKEDKLDPAVDVIIHMGACSSTTLDDAEYFEVNNFAYTQTLAQWAVKKGVRFIYASSAATYGDGSNGYKDDDETIRKCSPLNLYGQSKQKFDLWALENGYLDRIVGLKFFNVFGPNEYHKKDMRSVVAKTHQRVVDEGKIALFKSYNAQYADGEQKRDFVYVKDVVDIVLYFMDRLTVNGIYNVGSGEARTWNDLANAIFKAVGKSPDIEYIEMPENLKSIYQYFTQADISKLRQCGYTRDLTPLEDAVSDYTDYLKEHRYL